MGAWPGLELGAVLGSHLVGGGEEVGWWESISVHTRKLPLPLDHLSP